MGWWSAAVLGGDGPLDAVFDFEALIGVAEIYPLEDQEATTLGKIRDGFNKHMNGVRHLMTLADDGPGLGINAQVGATLLMGSGAEFPQDLRDVAIEAARNDEWAAEGEVERVQVMGMFIKQIQDYKPGTPSHTPDRSLGQALADMLKDIDQNK